LTREACSSAQPSGSAPGDTAFSTTASDRQSAYSAANAHVPGTRHTARRRGGILTAAHGAFTERVHRFDFGQQAPYWQQGRQQPQVNATHAKPLLEGD
jgi:hypothetical protein